MSRVVAALVVALLTASPAVGMVVSENGHAGRACCHGAAEPCDELMPRLSCCGGEAPAGPASTPPQVTSPTSGRDIPAAEVAAPPVPAPLVALVASRAFAIRQGLDIHAPPHLRLCVFLI